MPDYSEPHSHAPEGDTGQQKQREREIIVSGSFLDVITWMLDKLALYTLCPNRKIITHSPPQR